MDAHATPALDPDALDTLQDLLDAVPAPLEPLDVSMLDGYLAAVALQPRHPPPGGAGGWLRWVLDSEEGRAPPPGFDAEPLRALAMRRLQQLDAAIRQRQWFDPWVFELHGADEDAAVESAPALDLDPDEAPGQDADVQGAVLPWVAGFALGAEVFAAGLMSAPEAQLLEPLAGLYQFLEADDLEDADALLAAIEGLEPPASLEEAVEVLVAHTLLLADVSRPQPTPGRAAPSRAGRAATGRSGRAGRGGGSGGGGGGRGRSGPPR